jgi:hypothetical protein
MQIDIPLEIPLGVNSDDSTFGGAAWAAEANNVRPCGGGWQTIGGWAPVETGLGGAVRAIFAMKRGSFLNMFYGTQGKLWQVLSFGTPADVTPTPAPAAEVTAWSLQSWGGSSSAVLLAGWTNGSGMQSTLHEQSGSSPAVAVTGAPAEIHAILVTPQRQVLALGCSEQASGNFNPLCIRGSDLEDYTDWTIGVANNGFEHMLEGGGAIVAGRMVGPAVAVWTTTGLVLGQFIGEPSQTYSFEPVAAGCGLANPNAVAVHNGVAWWIDSAMNLWTWGGAGTLPVRIPSTISRDIADHAAPVPAKAAVGYLRRYNEVWVLYRDLRDGGGDENSRYFAYCVEESARQQRPIWYQGRIARTAFLDDALAGQATINFKASALMGDAQGDVHLHEYDAQYPDSAHIRTADHSLDQGRRRLMLRGIRPDFERQSGDVSLTVFARGHPQAAATSKGPYALAPGADRLCFRASGRILAFTLSAAGAGFRLGRPVLEAVALGGK